MTQHNHQTAPTQFVEAMASALPIAVLAMQPACRSSSTSTLPHHGPLGSAVTGGFASTAKSSCSQRRCIQFLWRRAHQDRENGRQRGGVHQGAETDESRCARLFDRRLCRAEIALQAPDLVRQLVLVGTGRAVAKAWPRSRQRRRKSSAPPMTSPIISGFACISRSPRTARLRAASS